MTLPALPSDNRSRLRLLIIGVGLLTLLGVSWRITHPVNEFSAVPANVSTRVSPIQKTTIGKSLQRNDPALTGISLVENKKSDGVVEYTYGSGNAKRPNLIRTKNGKVVFERWAVPTNMNQLGYTTTTFLVQTYGRQDGRYIADVSPYGIQTVMIWAKKGFVVLIDPLGGTIHEMQAFGPTTIDQYKKDFGEPELPANSPLLKEGP